MVFPYLGLVLTLLDTFYTLGLRFQNFRTPIENSTKQEHSLPDALKQLAKGSDSLQYGARNVFALYTLRKITKSHAKLASTALVVVAVTALAWFSFYTSVSATQRSIAHPSTKSIMAYEDIIPVAGGEEIMSKKAHGTCPHPVQESLRWGCDREEANRVCCFNRHYAEHSGYFRKTSFLKEANKEQETFYDSVTGKPVFIAPKGRTWKEFVIESQAHGWPSFRKQEVVWENVRVLDGGETVSVDGTHLGHDLPDKNGHRYCINLVSIAGTPDGKPPGAKSSGTAAASTPGDQAGGQTPASKSKKRDCTIL